MATKKTQLDVASNDGDKENDDPGPPFPHPTSTPPGGGSWTWDMQVGDWIAVENREGA